MPAISSHNTNQKCPLVVSREFRLVYTEKIDAFSDWIKPFSAMFSDVSVDGN